MVRVSFNNTATVGIAAVAGDTLVLKDDNVQVGLAAKLTAADVAAGYKDVEAPMLSDGAHPLSATLTDKAGNTSAAAVAVVVNVDTRAPAAPIINPVAGDDLIGASEQTSVVSGVAEAGATVALSLGGTTRTLNASDTGLWSYALSATDIVAMGQGAETLSATARDAAGNVSSAGTRPISIDTVFPTATAAITGASDNVAPNLGHVASGLFANNEALAAALG